MKSVLIAATLTALAGASAHASGVNYSGSWPITAKMPPHFADTGCLTLTDNGTGGSPHSGPAVATGDMFGGSLTGTFQVVDNLMVINIESGSDTGEVVYLSFIGPAHDGSLNKGIFNDPGYFPVEQLTFGAKGGC